MDGWPAGTGGVNACQWAFGAIGRGSLPAIHNLATVSVIQSRPESDRWSAKPDGIAPHRLSRPERQNLPKCRAGHPSVDRVRRDSL